MNAREEELMKEARVILNNSDTRSLALMKSGDLIRHMGDQIAILRGYTHEERDIFITPLMEKHSFHIETQIRNYYRTGKFPDYPPETSRD